MSGGTVGRLGRWLAWAGALAGVVALVLAMALTRAHEARLEGLGDEAARLRAALDQDQALLALLRDPRGREIALVGAGPSPGARGRVLWDEGAGGLLVVTGLPPPPAGKVFQLWVLAAQDPPRPAGLFTVDASGAGGLRLPPRRPAPPVDGFLVTLEGAGGAARPSGPPHLVTRR